MDNKILVGVIVVLLVVIVFLFLQKPGSPAQPLCGDGKCETGEKQTCPQDCHL